MFACFLAVWQVLYLKLRLHAYYILPSSIIWETIQYSCWLRYSLDPMWKIQFGFRSTRCQLTKNMLRKYFINLLFCYSYSVIVIYCMKNTILMKNFLISEFSHKVRYQNLIFLYSNLSIAYFPMPKSSQSTLFHSNFKTVYDFLVLNYSFLPYSIK